jgi:sulfonate transport system permease protein
MKQNTLYRGGKPIMKNSFLEKFFLGLLVPVIVVIAWWLATSKGAVPSSLLPTLEMVKNAFVDMTSSHQLQTDLLISLNRVVKGFLVAAILGITLGTVMGMSKVVCEMLQPIITAIRQIPMIAWFPLIILWCGIGEESKVVIIVLAAFFPILVNTLSGIQSTPEGYIEVAKLYNLSKWQCFVKLYFPHALSQILVGLKLGLSVSWMAVVASELVAATSGIGYRMNDARSMMRSDKVIVCMLVIGIVGVLMDKLLSIIFSYITPWIKLNKKNA